MLHLHQGFCTELLGAAFGCHCVAFGSIGVFLFDLFDSVVVQVWGFLGFDFFTFAQNHKIILGRDLNDHLITTT